MASYTTDLKMARTIHGALSNKSNNSGKNVTMQRFAGGYFDANGVANYYLTDYQGNVTEVVNASGVVVQSVRYYPDGEPWMEPTGTNRYTFGGKERVNLGGLNQYDFGPRLLNAAAGVWGSPDRKAEKYYGISPYSYCAGNPIMFKDPTGYFIEGETEDDIAIFLDDIKQIFKEKKFKDFRKLLSVHWYGDNKNRLKTITYEKFAKAVSGKDFNEDERALMDIVVNTINSSDQHLVEYVTMDDRTVSHRAHQNLKSHYEVKEVEDDIRLYGGLSVYRVLDKGGGMTGTTSQGTHSVIFKDQPVPQIHLNGRVVASGHEIFGHARSLALGRGDESQHIDAVQVENLILRVMRINAVNTGICHGPGTFIPNHSDLPAFR